MFKIKINHKGDTVKYSTLNVSSMKYTDFERSTIEIVCNDHKLHSGDIVIFQENDGDQRVFRDEREITVVDKDTFTIDGFPDYSVYVTDVTSAITTYYVKEDSTYKNIRYLKFTTDYHDIISYRGDVVVRDNISKEYYTDDNSDNYERMCINDYILCDKFLYKTTGFTADRKYTFSEDFLNIISKYIYYIDADGNYVILGGGKIGDYVEFSDSQNITNVNKDNSKGLLIVPSDYSGKDDRDALYWCFNLYKDASTMKYIIENYNDMVFYCKDERFFTEIYKWYEYNGDKKADIATMPDASWVYDGIICSTDGGNTKYICQSSLELSLNIRYDGDLVIHTTTLSAEISNYNIALPITDSFATNLIQRDILGDAFLENEEQKAINSIIDYEKIQFSPSFITDEFVIDPDTGETVDDVLYEADLDKYLYKVNDIVFNLHFRERPKDSEGGYGNFDTYDEYYWNDLEKPDLLGSLGFTDEDVYYQKKKLKNSFIRLSYYDTRNRGNQTLLGYSTVFVDTGKLYRKYVDVISAGIYGEGTELVNKTNSDEAYRLSMSLECSSKYNTEMSSDGFYMYLYKNVISGTTLTPIYIKAEFNHAKYGKTISLSYPVDDKYIPLDKPPVNYRKGTDDVLEIDTAKAIKDTYIKVFVKYNPETNDYVWFLPRTSDSDTITFDLYEPRINGLSVNENYDGTIDEE